MKTTDILATLETAGIVVQEQASFYKAFVDGKALYVAKSKGEVCTRIDVSGFSIPEHPAWAPPAKKNGKVTAVINGRHERAPEALALAIMGLKGADIKGSKLY